MDRLPDAIELSAADGSSVVATLVPLTRDLAQTKIDGAWWQLPNVRSRQRHEENDHWWQWAKGLGEIRQGRHSRWYEAVAAQTPEGDIQGAMIYRVDAKSFRDPAQGALNIENLATAPRNRPWLVESPLYRGVGEGLLLRAVGHSYLLGLGGRVNLLAFADERTSTFYKNRGFEVAGHDEGLPLLEMSPDTAVQWLRKEGYEL